MKLNRRGFTLIEVIVVAAIIAILAGVLVPMIFNQIDESKKTKALGDTKSLASAITAFYNNVKRWPAMDTVTGDYNMASAMTGTDPAYLPTLPGSWTTIGPYSNVGRLANHLGSTALSNDIYSTGAYAKFWKGPYFNTDELDPWGKAYVVNVGSLYVTGEEQSSVWILSAGPNGVIETTPADSKIPDTSDDIGFRLR